MPPPPNGLSLKERVLRAGGWTIAGQFCSLMLRLGGNLILTRLLAPEMFGLMAVVYVLITGFALLSDTGTAPSIIRSRRGEDPEFLNTAWIVQILRGALIWLLVLLMATLLPVIAPFLPLNADSVYLDPSLPLVIAVFAISSLISGFQSTKIYLNQRRTEVARFAQIELISQSVALAAMISWAVLSPSIWALVAGAIVAITVQMTLSHFWMPGPANKWQWDPAAFREIFGFGRWVLISSVLHFLALNGDRLLLGGLVDARLLGLYSIAFLLVSVPQLLVSRLVTRVAYPALSEVARRDPDRLCAVYYKFRLPADLALLFLAGALFVCGEAVIRLLYDSRYFGAGSIMQILALTLVAERYELATQCYIAMGKPAILVLTNVVRLCSLGLMPIGFWLYQFEGVVWAIALRPFLTLPVIFHFKRKYRLLEWRRELLVLPAMALGAGSGWLLAGFLGRF